MIRILLGVIAVLVMISSFLYNQNKTLISLNQSFELRDVEQKAAIESMQKDFTLQTESLLNVQSRNQKIEAEMGRYLDIFKRHNLTKLASARPGLLEPRVNNGTKEVFDSIEEVSRNIDHLDDGVQLQPDTK